jgi:hypothetical protein
MVATNIVAGPGAETTMKKANTVEAIEIRSMTLPLNTPDALFQKTLDNLGA